MTDGLMGLTGAALLDWARQCVALKLQLSAMRHSEGCGVDLGRTPAEKIVDVCCCRERYTLYDLLGRRELLGVVVKELEFAGLGYLADVVVSAVARPLQYEATVDMWADDLLAGKPGSE